MKTLLPSKFAFAATVCFLLSVTMLYAQLPNVSYTPSTYVYGTTIATLYPNNSGGVIPAGIPGGVTTLAGSGGGGSTDGTGTVATFNGPYSSVSDRAGNLYVADYGNNKIRKIVVATGVVTTLAGSGTAGSTDGTGTAATFTSPAAMAYDGTGNLYVADYGSNKIRKIVIATGVVTTLAGSGATSSIDGTGTAATLYRPVGIVYDGAGNLYVVDYNGNKIRKIVISTGVVTTLAGSGAGTSVDGTGVAATFSNPSGIALDGAGNLYVTDFSTHKIRKIVIATGVVTTLAGTGSSGAADGTGTAASFNNPRGIASDDMGNLYVADYNNNKIRKIVIATGVVTTYAGSGATSSIDGVGTAASFYIPTGITYDGNGKLFVTDNYGNKIRTLSTTGFSASGLPQGLSIDQSTGYITGTPTKLCTAAPCTITVTNKYGTASTLVNFTVALPAPSLSAVTPQSYVMGTAITPLAINNAGGAIPLTTPNVVTTLAGNTANMGSVDGTGAGASFTSPFGIVYDGVGNVYVADANASKIRKIVVATGVVTTIAGSGTAASTDGTGTGASFNYPRKLCYDGAGVLYISDMNGNKIRKLVLSTGVVTTLAGSGTSSSVDGTGTAATFYGPSGIVTDGLGNLYVTDMNGNKIRKIVIATGVVTTLAGGSSSGTIDGTGTAALFSAPADLTYDGTSNLYVTDQSSNKIRKIVIATGVVTTIAGSGTGSSVDGTGTAATFNQPTAVMYDNGNLYVTEYAGHKIRKIVVSTGVVTTFAGNGTAAYANGPLASASFNAPSCITTDGFGNFFIGEFNNYTIRQISFYGYSNVSPALPLGLNFNPVTGQIIGTPLATSAATNYTISGSNATGSSSTVVNIAVTLPTAPVITYSTPPAYTYGLPITPLTPTSTGGAVPATVPFGVSTLAGSGATGSADGIGTAATFSGPYRAVCDGQGNMYVSDMTNNRIRKIVLATGMVSTLAGSGTGSSVDGIGTAASFYNPSGICYDGIGNLYVFDRNGWKIRKIVIATGDVRTVAGYGTGGSTDGTGNNAYFSQASGMAYDGQGNLYVADTYNNSIRKVVIATGVVTTLAGSGTASSIDGTGTAATFNSPTDVVCDGVGNLYIADQSGNRIRKIVIATGVVSTLAGNSGSYADGIGTAASFKNPQSIAYDGQGNLYVGDRSNYRIRKIVIATAVVSTIVGSGSNIDMDGVGTDASIFNFNGICYDGQGNLYVAGGNNNIRKVSLLGYTINPTLPLGLKIDATGTISGTPGLPFSSTAYTVTATNLGGSSSKVINLSATAPVPAITYSTPQVYSYNTPITPLSPTNTGGLIPVISSPNMVSTLAGSGTQSSTDGTGLGASFNNPFGAALDGQGNLYVADVSGQKIRKIVLATGVVTTLAGSGSSGSYDGIGAAASFYGPSGICYDGNGNLYVADQSNYKIRKIAIASGAVSTVAGSGSNGSTDGIGTSAGFNYPSGITCDGANLYVSEYNSGKIREIVIATKVVTTLAGSGTQASTDGTGTGASFYYPYGIACDGVGNLYVADWYGHKIRKVVIATGVVTTLAGSGTAGTTDGTGTAASFYNPRGITYDGQANLYVTDNAGHKIRKIVIATGVVTTLAGTGTAAVTNGAVLSASFNAPAGIAFDGQSAKLYVTEGTGQTVRTITLPGGYSVSPSLPLGLSFDNTTGIISGMPATISAATNYTVTATNAMGSSSKVINLTINAPVAAPVISYSSPQTYNFGKAITALSPANTGGAVPAVAQGTVTTVAGGGTTASVDGTGALAYFTNPQDVVYDGQGNAYVADGSGNKIRKIVIATGVVTTLAGSGTAGSANGTGTAATFNNPTGITYDRAGNLYVTDQGGQQIRKIVIVTGVVTTLAGAGGAGSADGIGTAATFYGPYGITNDGTNLYVADYNNHKIRKIVMATGEVTTLAGSGTASSIDGTGTAATFYNPRGITYDGKGNLYVADYLNKTIRKIVISTAQVTTFAGSGIAASTDGMGTAAAINYPSGIVSDGWGNLYISEWSGNRIRKIVVSTAAVTTLAGTGSAGSVDGIGTQALLNSPQGMAIDGDGNLLVTEQNGNKIRKIVLSGYSTAGPLPAGLSMDATTGTISGTPSVVSAATNYTVTATNLGGTSSATVNIKVNAPTAPVISYSSPQTYTFGSAISPLSPTNTGGGVPATVPTAVSTLAGSGSGVSTDGTGTAASFYYPTGVASDGVNLYVTDNAGNKIRKINIITKAVTTLAGSGTASSVDGTGTAASFSTPKGIAYDGLGNLYVADYGSNKIRKIVIATGVVTTLAGSGSTASTDGTGTSASFNAPNGITYDGAANLYVTDNGGNKIRKIVISSTVVTTLAGSGASTSIDGTGAAASLYAPIGITYDGTGNLYVGDNYGRKIRKIVVATAVVTTLAGSGTNGYTDGTGAAASFSNPQGILSDGIGNLYIADNNKIRKIVIATAGVTTVAGDGTSTSNDGLGTSASFYFITGLATDGSGNIYIGETNGNKIRVFSPYGYSVSPALPQGLSLDITGAITGTPLEARAATNYTITASNAAGSASSVVNMAVIPPTAPAISYSSPQTYPIRTAIAPLTPTNSGGVVPNGMGRQVSTLAGSGTYGSTDNTGIAATFARPMGVATDGLGNLYVVENYGFKIRKIVIATGVVTTLAGSGTAGSTDATGTAATFNYPTGVAYDAGNLYVADQSSNKIRKIVISTGVVTTLAGSGTTASTDGTGTAAAFYRPSYLTCDGLGNLFVSEQSGNKIRKIVIATGVVTTLAGSGTASSVDGTGTAATFNNPNGICYDGAGNLYVLDYAGHKLRKIVIATGVVTTLAGSGTGASTDGTGTGASFYYPHDLTLDGLGNIYVAEEGNKIRKVVITTGVVTTVAGSGAGTSTDGTGTAASFYSPQGITFIKGMLYFSECYGYKIRTLSPFGYDVSPALPDGLTLGTDGSIMGTPTYTKAAANYTVTGTNSVGSSQAVVNIAVTSSLTAPVISYSTPQTYNYGTAITPLAPTNTGGAVTAVPSVSTVLAGNATASSLDGVGISATFNQPYAAVPDGLGNLYVADCNGNKIRKIVISTGVVTTLAGSGTATSTDGTGTAATFYYPKAIASDGLGNLYVADQNGCKIRKIVIATGVVTTVAGSGTSISTDGTGAGASFVSPTGLVYINGSLYITDYGASRVKKMDIASGSVTTIAGNATAGSTDGTGVNASFNYPYAITSDGAGNLYVTDLSGYKIRKIVIATGAVTTLAGSGTNASTDGTATGASFASPGLIVCDGAGNLYVADQYAIRKIVISTAVVTTVLATPGSQILGLGYDGFGTLYYTDNTRVLQMTTAGGYSVSPALPVGLSLNANNGTISGSPLATSAATNYTVTATNVSGSANTVLNLKVNALAAPVISYPSPQTYTYQTAITPLPLTNTGGAVPATIPLQVTTLAGSGTAASTDGTGVAASFYTPQGVAYDGAGYIYVADYSSNKIRKVEVATGVVTTLAGSGTAASTDGIGATASFNRPYDIVCDKLGNLYVTDNSGCKIRKIVIATGVVTTLAGSGTIASTDGTGAGASFYAPAGITCDGTANLYVTEYSGHKIRKIVIASGQVTTLAGSGTAGSADGTGTAATFTNPIGITYDAGNLYVADKGNNEIRKIVISTGVVTTFAGSTAIGSTDGIGTAASFYNPTGITSDGLGNLYVTDYTYNTLRKIVIATATVSTLAGNNGGSGTVDGIGTAASFNRPFGLTCDGLGNMYITESSSNKIRKMSLYGYKLTPDLPGGLNFDLTSGTISGTPTATSPAQNYTLTATNVLGVSASAVVNIAVTCTSAPAISYTTPQTYSYSATVTPLSPTNTGGAVPVGAVAVTTLAGNGTAASVDGSGISASFNSPKSGVSDGAGNLYVTDQSGNVIRKIVMATGVVTTLAGSGTAGFVNGTGLAASFSSPQGIAYDGQGNLYVADNGNSYIRKIVIATGVVTSFASVSYPYGIVYDGAGNLFATNYSLNQVFKIVIATAKVTTVAGSGSAVSTDGTGTGASFYYPMGIATDGCGNLYVADNYGHKIRKVVVSTGVVTTIAGSGTATELDGTGTAAAFKYPQAIVCDKLGSLFVTDVSGNTVRKIDIASATVTTLAGNGVAASINNANPLLASINYPTGVVPDGQGNLLVMENGANKIRKIALAGFSISPALPLGLSFGSDGTISGTPIFPTDPIDYTVTATNGYGSSKATLNITVYPLAAPVITYPTPKSYYQNAAIVTLSPTALGVVDAYSISPALPTGLSFDTSTGKITGTPTALSAATDYTVTATNIKGTGTFVVNIAVVVAPPTALSYTATNVYTKGTAITSLSPTVTSTVASYSVSPALPGGLSLDATSGVISGTPTALAVAANYTVTATNASGNTTFAVNITVNDVIPSELVYTTPNVLSKNIAITNLTPASSGGAVVSYSVSPALPAGLSLNTTTGIISGTPTAVSAAADYTITATNTGGSTTFVTNITVVNGFIITFGAPANGTLTVKNGATTINSGDIVLNASVLTVTATPNTGYILSSLKANGVDIVSNTVTINSLTTIVAVFVTPSWTGATDTDWNNATNWTPNVVPTGLIDIVVNSATNTPVVGDNSVCNNLTVNTGGVITIPAGKSLTVAGSITNSAGAAGIVIKSSPTLPNGTLIFNNAQAAPVQATVEMYSKASWNLANTTGNKYKWQFFGVPVRTLVTAPTLTGALVRRYDESQPVSNWFALNASSVLDPFTGYEIAQSAAKVYTYTGDLVNADLSRTLSYTTGALNPGSQLFANPFAAAIDITKLNFGTQTDATVYLYNTGTVNEWATYSGATDGANPGQYTAVPKATAGVGGIPGQIPSMQGFVVKALSNDANATFGIPYSAVVTKNVDQQRVKSEASSAASNMVYSIVDVVGATGGDRMWLFSDPSCSHNFDNGWDGRKMLGSTLVPQLYAKEADGDYQVNSVNDVNNTDLGFQAGTDSDYKLHFTHNNVKSVYSKLYLFDYVTGTTTDITESGTEYSFSASAGTATSKRFKIISTTNTVTGLPDAVTDAKVIVFSSKNIVFVQNGTGDKGDLMLYDIAGRFIEKLPFGANAITSLPMSLVPGVYVAKAVINNKVIVNKNMIIQ